MSWQKKMSRHVPICTQCNILGKRNEEHDAYYCVNCWQWLEDICGDMSCSYCKNRPDVAPRGKHDPPCILPTEA
jgi:hypothetical protein